MSDVNTVAAVPIEVSVADKLGGDSGLESGSWVSAKVPSGEFAGGWLIVEAESRGEQQCAVVAADPVGVVACGPISQVKLWAWSIPDAAVPAWVVPLAAAHIEAARAHLEAETARRAVAAHGERLEAIVDAAHTYADDNSLCSQFDAFMVEQGLRPRSNDYEVVVDVTLRVRITASGHDADAASETVGEEEVTETLYNLARYDLSNMVAGNIDVVDVAAL